MTFLQNKINNIKNIVNTTPKSYAIYLISFSIFIPIGILLLLLSPKLFLSYINISIYTFVPLIIIAFLLDANRIIITIARNNIGKLLYAVLAYFAYATAELLSKNIIYSLTSADPEQFGSTVQFMLGLYFLPAWMIIIFLILSGLIFLMTSVLVLLEVLHTIFGKMVFFISLKNKIISFLEYKFNAHKYIFSHMFFFTIGLILFLTLYTSSVNGIIKWIPQKEIASLVLSQTSYYKNQLINNEKLTCTKIPQNTFIKFIGDNKVSTIVRENHLNNHISFTIEECN